MSVLANLSHASFVASQPARQTSESQTLRLVGTFLLRVTWLSTSESHLSFYSSRHRADHNTLSLALTKASLHTSLASTDTSGACKVTAAPSNSADSLPDGSAEWNLISGENTLGRRLSTDMHSPGKHQLRSSRDLTLTSSYDTVIPTGAKLRA